MAAPKKLSVVGPLTWGLISLFVGGRLLATGRAGYRAGYAAGDHVRIGGAILLGLGIWMVIVAARRLSKKEADPNRQRTTRGM